MSKVKHSPLPWMVSEAFGNTIVESEDVAVARMTGTPEEIEANAAFIVKACNAHDELVRALEKIDANAAESVEWIRRVAKEALAKVESQTP